MTNMWVIRDSAVVTSSVIPSAKYCWSVSLLRLPKGSTTIDMRGATSCGADAATGAPAVGDRGAGHTHQATPAITSAAAAAAKIITGWTRLRRGATRDTLAAGKPTLVSGGRAEGGGG